MSEKNNIVTRVATSLVLSSVAFVAFNSDFCFLLFVFLIIILGVREWFTLCKNYTWLYPLSVLLVFSPVASSIILYFSHKTLFLLMVCGIIACDITAYCSGKFFRGAKLCPFISPNKTWAGFFGGILGTMLVSIFFLVFMTNLNGGVLSYVRNIPTFLLFGLVLSLLSQIGDLTESLLKRLLKVKDSGFILPGHGGILDRIDGFIYSAPFVYIFGSEIDKLLHFV